MDLGTQRKLCHVTVSEAQRQPWATLRAQTLRCFLYNLQLNQRWHHRNGAADKENLVHVEENPTSKFGLVLLLPRN